MAAHSLGRIEEALRPTPAPAAEDFLSGAQRDRRRARAARSRAALDARARRRLAPRPASLASAAACSCSAIERPGMPHGRRSRAELRALAPRRRDPARPTSSGRGKFENLNALLGATGRSTAFDWVLVVDDDVVLPRGFLDRFLAVAERFDLKLAQPAHRLASHAAWPVTRRRPASVARETAFVEIGPVTAFHRDTFDVLLPFPDLRMGWGLDVHWAAVARERGWQIGVVDATPILHTVPTADDVPARGGDRRGARLPRDRPVRAARRGDRTLRTHR